MAEINKYNIFINEKRIAGVDPLSLEITEFTTKGFKDKHMNKYELLTKQIVKYLETKGVYDKIDDTLIQLLVDSYELYDMAWDDIRKRGFQIDISKESDDREYFQTNNSVSSQTTSQKTITAISTKLGLTVLDRTKLKLTDAKPKKDQLGEIL